MNKNCEALLVTLALGVWLLILINLVENIGRGWEASSTTREHKTSSQW